MRRLLVAGLAAAFLAPAAALASFHEIMIVEVFSGTAASPNAQYVVLQMWAPGQTFVTGHALFVYDTDGNLVPNGTLTFGSDLGNGLNQATALIATSQAQTLFGVTADLTMSPVLPPGGGKLCWDTFQYDCVAWGGYSGAAATVGTPFPGGGPLGRALKRRLDVCAIGSPTILESCDDTNDSATDFVLGTPNPRNNAGTAGIVPASTCSNTALEGLEGCDDGNLTPGDGCSAVCLVEPGNFAAQALTVDAAASGTSNGNGVLDPGETVVAAPSWKNNATDSLPLIGFASQFTAAGGVVTYSVPAGSAPYGPVASGATASCNAGANGCFQIGVAVTTRPSQHLDASFTEILSDTSTSKIWPIHVGLSFPDVPSTMGFYRFVETLLHDGVTGGCSGGNYCPSDPATRGQMAVFLLVSREGSAYSPPACVTPMFNDVPCSSGFARWINELANRGVTAGCGGGNYCPSDPATRGQMAVFLLVTKEGSAYSPPACTTPMFNDVPCSSGFAPWINELANRGITAGCGNNNYCPGNPVTRGQMAVFLTTTFALTLYGP